MSLRIKRLKIKNLFGHLNHEVGFRDDTPTILTGPNGSGKTHVLKILRALVGLELWELPAYPFDAATLQFAAGFELRVNRVFRGEEWVLDVVGERRGSLLGRGELRPSSFATVSRKDLPSWIEQTSTDEWYDRESNEWLNGIDMERRFGIPDRREVILGEHAWLEVFRPGDAPTFIETGRLDLTFGNADVRRVAGRTRRIRSRPAIERYVERIQSQVGDARRQSLAVSQKADREFASRALDKARQTVKEADLRRRYESIVRLHRELHENGLTEQSIAVEFPEQKTTPTERRILNVFLEDWEEKLAPLIPVHEKIQILRTIVETKIRDKAFVIDSAGDITFRSAIGDVLRVGQLSSGEQHMLALFTMLLFAAQPNSHVLIDEPEISLHAAWKHEFLDDLDKVSKSISVTVVMATHSTALINSRWDLVEELGVIDGEA